MHVKDFLSRFRLTFETPNKPVPAKIKRRVDDDFLYVIEHLGGKTFDNGLYRVYRGDEIEKYTEIICEQFDAIQGQAYAFAADWMGRQFVIDFTEMQHGQPTVGLLEPGVPESCSSDLPIGDFHNVELVNGTQNALAEPFFKDWRKKTRGVVPPDKCVGYQLPLFLGGEETLDNMELVDMEVYLHFCVKLWNKVKDLPDGTSIGNITIDDND